MGMKGKIIGVTISTAVMLAGAGAAYYKKRKARKAEKKQLKEAKKAEKEGIKLIALRGSAGECVNLMNDKENLDILKKLSYEVEKMDEKEIEDIETTFSKIIVNAETGETALEWFDRVFPSKDALERDLAI